MLYKNLFFCHELLFFPETVESRGGTVNPKSRLDTVDRLLSISRTDYCQTGIVHESPRVCKRGLTYREHAATPQQWREAPAACRLSPLSACPSAAADPEAAGPRIASRRGQEMTGVQVAEKKNSISPFYSTYNMMQTTNKHTYVDATHPPILVSYFIDSHSSEYKLYLYVCMYTIYLLLGLLFVDNVYPSSTIAFNN